MTQGRHVFRSPEPGMPPPLERTLVRTIHFHEVDPMGIMWFGNYCRLMDEASAHLRAICGLSYDDFRREGIMAPVKRMEIDYQLPLVLAEEVRVLARMPWNEAMRIDTEFTILKQDGRVAAKGWMVQLFVEAADMLTIYVEKPFIHNFRERWRKGEFSECR
jgi:acyl-CoA thioester hydrolase